MGWIRLDGFLTRLVNESTSTRPVHQKFFLTRYEPDLTRPIVTPICRALTRIFFMVLSIPFPYQFCSQQNCLASSGSMAAKLAIKCGLWTNSRIGTLLNEYLRSKSLHLLTLFYSFHTSYSFTSIYKNFHPHQKGTLKLIGQPSRFQKYINIYVVFKSSN